MHAIRFKFQSKIRSSLYDIANIMDDHDWTLPGSKGLLHPKLTLHYNLKKTCLPIRYFSVAQSIVLKFYAEHDNITKQA